MQSSSADGSTVGVKVAAGALPDRSDAQMFEDSKGALVRSLRSKALAARHRKALVDEKLASTNLRKLLRKEWERIKELESSLRDCKRGRREELAAATARARVRVNYTILEGKTETEARALCGVSGLESLKVSAKSSASVGSRASVSVE